MHDHLVSTGVCHESLDMAFQCVAKEVSKTPTAKNSMILVVTSKQFLVDYILKSPLPREKNQLHSPSLEMVMDKFSTLAYKNFMVGSKRFIQSK